MLKLGNNNITRLPHEIGQLEKLRSLDMTKNKLKLLPPDLGELEEVLQELSLSLNPCSYSPPRSPIPFVLHSITSACTQLLVLLATRSLFIYYLFT